jgi:methionyl-tRNA formyltransferase
MRLLRKLHERAAVAGLEARQMATYRAFFEVRGAPPFAVSGHSVIRTRELNSPGVVRAIESTYPDVVLVSGTRIIRSPLLDVKPSLGLINLHTGLAPYYRGGPCTFWALFNEEPEYAGATVHHLTPGIDSGDIVLSARASLDYTDSVASLDCRVIDLGHALVARALALLAQGLALRVPQWEKGRLFLYRQFTAAARLDLEGRLAGGLMERCLRRLREHPPAIRTVEPA